MTAWNTALDALGRVLVFFHDLLEPIAGVHSWGWGIVLLTLAVRVLLLPLAVKQINSMRGMQKLQPEMKRIQAKYKTDRDMMRKNPEKARERRQKQQEELMGLYKEHGVNPAASCLPLLAQMPVFIALFWLLRNPDNVPSLAASTFGEGAFYFVPDLSLFPVLGEPSGAWALVVLMGLSTYLSQKQMMASNPSATVMPQQKVLLYVMPVMLVVFSFQMPVGVLLYWVTTNLWTMAQQFVMFRKVEPPREQASAKD